MRLYCRPTKKKKYYTHDAAAPFMVDARKCESYTIFTSRVIIIIITQSADCPTPRAQADEHYKSSSEKRSIVPQCSHVLELILSTG